MTGLFFMSLGKTCVSYKEVDSTAFIIIAIIIYCFSFVYPSIVDMHSNKLYCGSYILWFLYSFSGIDLTKHSESCELYSLMYICSSLLELYVLSVYAT